MLEHMFKYLYKPSSQSTDWISSIIESYNQITKIAINSPNKIVTPKTKFSSDYVSIISNQNSINYILSAAADNVIKANPEMKDTNFSFDAFYGYFDNFYELCDSVRLYNFLINYAKNNKIITDVNALYMKNKLKTQYTDKDMKEFSYSNNNYY